MVQNTQCLTMLSRAARSLNEPGGLHHSVDFYWGSVMVCGIPCHSFSIHIPMEASRLLRKNTASVLVGTQTPLLETSCSLDVLGN